MIVLKAIIFYILFINCYDIYIMNNIFQEIFGISSKNVYIFVGIFLFFTILLVVAQLLIKKHNKKYLAYLPFCSIFLALIIVLPFEAKVNYVSWGNTYNGVTNNSIWYAQIMQFAILFGNVYMVMLVIFLFVAMFFNIIKTMYTIVSAREYVNFFKYTLIFCLISISMLLLINLYRVFPIFSYDMSNNPESSFINYGSPIGINTFKGEGYWPFFITNFLISYFFTGNYDVLNNINSNYDIYHQVANPSLPIQVPIVLGLFSLAFIIGCIIGYFRPNDEYCKNIIIKTNKFNNRLLNIIYSCLSVASLSFFSESLLQSQIGTWMHIVFVFIIMLLAWFTIYLVSSLMIIYTHKISFIEYYKIFISYLFQAFKRNNLDDNEFKKANDIINSNIYSKYYHFMNEKSIVSEEYKQLGYIAETTIFPIILIGYLSFMPTNGWMFTSNCNTVGYWFAMFFGSYFCYLGSYGLSGISTVGQNMQASCAFNVMCGTNTGIFGPFGFIMNKFRIQIDLNYLFIIYTFQDFKIIRENRNKKIPT